ncbi:bifunctional diguanylate cyclase/phosphodiesterase [Herbaspirillum sp. HC18]|nr:bifunctional diguanylate cyclase/phosphodiesterase [Herbaspirillum sp. HC18]
MTMATSTDQPDQNFMLPGTLYEAVFASSPAGGYLLTPTPEATILAVNDAFLKAASCRREHLVGKSLFEVFPENPDDLEDTGVEALRASLARVVATGEPETLHAQRYPIPVTGPDGKVRYEERFWCAVNTPIFDQDGRLLCILHITADITERLKTEAALRETAARLKFTLESAQAGDWDLDLVNDVFHRSLRHDQCFGYREPVPEWDFAKLLQHVHPEDRTRVRAGFEEAVGGSKDWHVECRVIWPDGTLHWIAIHGSIYSAGGKVPRMLGIVGDITERKQTEEEVRHASLHDPLTRLPNRAMLFEYAGHLLPYNKRTSQHAAVLFLDLDRFKPINDTHGHEVGDFVLKEVASRLSRSLRAADVVIRLGGDEFVILLQDIKNPAFAADVARHIIDRINEPYCMGALTLSLSTSVGISIFPDDGQDIDTLVSHADMAMYQAKQAGRNTYQFYSPELAAGTKLQMAIEQQLKSALHSRSFYLCYQPVVDIESGEVVSVEALLRWRDNSIGPGQFVPVAEATGLINPIGRWLLEEASRQHKEWISHGLPAIPIAVNVSVVEFRDKEFVTRFDRTIQSHGIDTSALQLELTETTMMDDIDYAVSVLSQLKSLGVKVLLDDFGTGHSSLAYLARLPLNKIKIDKSFVSRLESDVASRAVTDAMIALGRTLNLEIVAEGIESPNVLEYVCTRGCKQAQGFYLGTPMPGDVFEAWYREQGQTLKDARYRDISCH